MVRVNSYTIKTCFSCDKFDNPPRMLLVYKNVVISSQKSLIVQCYTTLSIRKGLALSLMEKISGDPLDILSRSKQYKWF